MILQIITLQQPFFSPPHKFNVFWRYSTQVFLLPGGHYYASAYLISNNHNHSSNVRFPIEIQYSSFHFLNLLRLYFCFNQDCIQAPQIRCWWNKMVNHDEINRQNMLVALDGGTCWWNILLHHVGGTSWWNMLVEHRCGLCWWNMLVDHVGGTCWWNKLVDYLCGTCW